MMDVEERVKFYLGDCLNKEYTSVNSETPEKIIQLDSNNFHIYTTNVAERYNRMYDIYIRPLRELLNEYNIINKNIHLKPGDVNMPCGDFYAFSKTRRIVDEKYNYVLIKCLERERHWQRLPQKRDTIQFANKHNKAIWRGTSTGRYRYCSEAGTLIKDRYNNRITLIDKYFLSEYADIALTDILQDSLKVEYNHALKERITIEELRSYKYIISIEGNDKDSGLNWKLMSNSVVLMAKPIYNSWLMEEKLIPGVHYVQLKDDLSDLEEKISWCNENPDACKDIINNAQEYMKQFFKPKLEKIIEHKVITSFIDSTNQ